MKKLINFISRLFIFLCLLFVGYIMIRGFIQVSNNVNKIDTNILVAIIAGTVTILGFFITRYLEKKKIIEQQIREQKLPVYEEFVGFLFKVFKQTKDNKKINEKELGEFYWEMNKKSILWLSDATLKSYSIWKSMTIEFSEKTERTEKDNILILLSLERLLLDFRKDIGHENKDLKKGDILKLFINGWDNYNKENKK